jgi:hypothetical protein
MLAQINTYTADNGLGMFMVKPFCMKGWGMARKVGLELFRE